MVPADVLLALNTAPRRRVVFANSEFHLKAFIIFADLLELLHETLTVRGLPDDDCPIVILYQSADVDTKMSIESLSVFSVSARRDTDTGFSVHEIRVLRAYARVCECIDFMEMDADMKLT